MIKDRDQPIGVRRLDGIGNAARWRGFPCPVREQEVDFRWIIGSKFLIRRYGIITEVDRAEQTREEVPECWLH